MIEKPEITIEYSLSYKDFVAGHKLAVRQIFPLFLVHILFRYVALTIALLLSAMCVVNLFGGHASTVPSILPLVVLFFLMPAIFWISWRFGYNRLKLSPKDEPQMTFQSDKSSFARQIHRMGDLTWLWSATDRVTENKNVVLIMVRKGCFIVLPRRVVSDVDLARLKNFLRDSREVSC